MYGEQTPAWRLLKSYFPELYSLLAKYNVSYRTYNVSSGASSAHIDFNLSDEEVVGVISDLTDGVGVYYGGVDALTALKDLDWEVLSEDIEVTRIIRERLEVLSLEVIKNVQENLLALGFTSGASDNYRKYLSNTRYYLDVQTWDSALSARIYLNEEPLHEDTIVYTKCSTKEKLREALHTVLGSYLEHNVLPILTEFRLPRE